MADWTREDWTGDDWAAPVSVAGPRGVGRATPTHRPGRWPARALVRHPRLVGATAAALLACAVGLVLQARQSAAPALPQDAHVVLEPPAWSPILRPVPSFVLDTPLFPASQIVLSARRHNPGGGREEILSLGQPGSPQGFGRVVLYRTGSEAGTPGSLFLDLARRAAEDGHALLRSAQPATMASKFGPIEAADMVLGGPDGEQGCAAWRIVADEVDLRIIGWLCAPEGKPVDRAALACLVDRLQLSPAQTDGALRTFFKDADRRRRPGCAPARQAPAGRRPA